MNNNMNQLTPQNALALLDQATHPANAGKLNRADYANINHALEVLGAFVEANTPKPALDPEPVLRGVELEVEVARDQEVPLVAS